MKSFPSDNSKLAEMEFYLVDDLECDLVVFHPYRTLMSLCGKEGSSSGAGMVTAELFGNSSDGQRYWGTGQGKLELQEGALQLAWYESKLNAVEVDPNSELGLSSTTRTAQNYVYYIHHISSLLQLSTSPLFCTPLLAALSLRRIHLPIVLAHKHHKLPEITMHSLPLPQPAVHLVRHPVRTRNLIPKT